MPRSRLLSMSRSGRFVAIRQSDGVDLVDAIGTSPRRALRVGEVSDFACVGATVWVIADRRLLRFSLDSGQAIEPVLELPREVTGLEAAQGDNAHTALAEGPARLLLHGLHDRVACEDVTASAPLAMFAAPLYGRRLLIGDGPTVRFLDGGREVGRTNLGDEHTVVAASGLFGGRAVAVLARGPDADAFLVVQPSGAMIHRVPVTRAERAVIAETRGIAVLQGDDGELLAIDLRYGRVQGRARPPLAVTDLGIDADGRYLAMAGPGDLPGMPAVLHLPFTDVFIGGGAVSRPAPRPAAEPAPPAATTTTASPAASNPAADRVPRLVLRPPSAAASGASTNGASSIASSNPGDANAGDANADDASATDDREPVPAHGLLRTAPLDQLAVDAAAGEAALSDEPDEVAPPPIEVPDLPPLVFGKPVVVRRPPTPLHALAYASPREHLDELLELAAARAYRAIADAWNSGRLSVPSDSPRPFEKEVAALSGGVLNLATDVLAEALDRLRTLQSRIGPRTAAALSRGLDLPFIELVAELELDQSESNILLTLVAPALRGEIARLYGVLANDEHRSLCDRYLVETILAGADPAGRSEIARALGPDGALIRTGVVRVLPHAAEQYTGLSVDPVVLARLRGNRWGVMTPGEVTTIRRGTRRLEELVMPAQLKRDVVLALAGEADPDRPVRLVIRGRRGTGRRSLVAALAERVARRVSVIDCERLPRAGSGVAEGLRVELRRAYLRSTIPCVVNLEVIGTDNAEAGELVRAMFRAHAGPLVICTSPEFAAPLDPGHLTFTIPALSEGDRHAFWREALARAGLEAREIESLGSRFRIGPGIIETVIASALPRLQAAQREQPADAPPIDASAALDAAARQHVASRMGRLANHIQRLARWEQVALPDDLHDSIREFVGRVKHRRTVYERWGFDAKMQTSRGLTALFYGPPGTGKSMVAGLIAHELGLDLYRVDVSRVTSKWIGETEKNLAEIFDAGEDGQVVILFDEADSLFAKRTEVKSSVDRYANLEVNYLLQRLDSFEGIAILTTNFEGSIDNAFKRRLSLRLAFPFPDEEMRVRLWATHIPSQTPIAGDFDFVDLARRFPLSGGYIRNSALRAAFLAAQEGRPLAHEHLLRAIQLEYRELGKLSTTGRME